MSAISKLRDAVKARGIDAAVIFDELNIRYLSGFSFSDGCLFITNDSAYLITDFRYFEMAEKKANNEFKVIAPDSQSDFVKAKIQEYACKTIGFEGKSVSYASYRRYNELFAPAELVCISEIIEEIRQIKSPEEIELIRRAQRITDSAFSHVLSVITPNMTELDVATELEYAMRKNGADGFAFETIAVSGDASALPHGKPRAEKLHRGFLTMDFGAKFDGYCSDMTRTIVIGRADDEMKKLYNTVLFAQSRALEFLCEGADLGETDRIARDIINSDYANCFGHSLGHSVGLYIHETPGLSKRYLGKKARIGEIFTVEPGIYLYGKYGCRIEDMVAIEQNGVRNFTTSSKELFEIY